MKTRAIAAALLVAFTPATFVTSTVLAQPAAADDAATKAARARFQEGVEFFDKGQFENARAAFKQAYALKNHPAVLLNLAQSSLKSGHPLEASKYFQQYLKDAGATDKPSAEKGLAEARSKLGRIDVTGPNGTEVTVDNERAGFVPLDPIDLDPGNHTIKTKTPDGATNEVTIPITAGQAFALKAGSAPVPTTKPPPDNPPPKDVRPLKHDILPLAVSGGVAVLGYVTWIIFGIARSGAQDKANSVDMQIRAAATKQGYSPVGICTKPPTTDFASACTTLNDNRSAVTTDNTVAVVGAVFAIGGTLGAIGGLVYYLVAKKPAESAPPVGTFYKPMITPLIGPGMGGLLLTGSF